MAVIPPTGFGILADPKPLPRGNTRVSADPAPDSWAPGGHEPGPPKYADLLAAGRGAQGHGASTVDPATVGAGRRDAQAHENDPVNWRDPSQTLKHLTQVDSDQGVQKGGDDQDRCGAAALVAGTVAMGPDKVKSAARAVAERGSALMPRVQEAIRGQSPGSPGHSNALRSFQALQQSLAVLQSVSALPPQKFTVGTLQQMQQAVYVVANLEQNLIGRESESVSGLGSFVLEDYRQRMWGSDRPRLGGRQQDVYVVQTPGGGGHFVLADGKGRVGYDPWPQPYGLSGAGQRISSREGHPI